MTPSYGMPNRQLQFGGGAFGSPQMGGQMPPGGQAGGFTPPPMGGQQQMMGGFAPPPMGGQQQMTGGFAPPPMGAPQGGNMMPAFGGSGARPAGMPNTPPPQAAPQGSPYQASGATQGQGGMGGQMPQFGGMGGQMGGGMGMNQGLLPRQAMMMRMRMRNNPTQGGGPVAPGPTSTLQQPVSTY